MPETDPCILGVQSCGCITFALAAKTTSRDDDKALMRVVREGGQVVRTTVGEARKMPYFLVGECPHDPKGWEPEREKPCEPHVKRCRSVRSRGVWRVDVAIEGWSHGRFPAGEVREWEGAWWATEGWFNYREAGAHVGDEPAPEYGPFKTKKEAAAALLPFAIKRGAELQAEWDEQRETKEAVAS